MQAFAGIILGVQILAALGMIGLILVQHGKGADMGAAFGGGSRAVCLVPAAAPTFCRVRRPPWPLCSL